jgi:Putative zinc-finger
LKADCGRIRDVLDSYMSDELLVETCHEIEAHLEDCPGCRGELEARSELRQELRRALAIEPGDAVTLRRKIETAIDAAQRRTVGRRPRRWLALAAGLVAAAAVPVALRWERFEGAPPSVAGQPAARSLGGEGNGAERLAVALPATFEPLDFPAVAWQHNMCAIQRRPAVPPSLEAAAHQLGPYQALLARVDYAAIGYRLLDAHVCPHDGHRLGHLVLEKDGEIVSVFATEEGELHAETGGADGDLPQFERHTAEGFEVERIVVGNERGFLVAADSRLPTADREVLVASLDRFLEEQRGGSSTHLR